MQKQNGTKQKKNDVSTDIMYVPATQLCEGPLQSLNSHTSFMFTVFIFAANKSLIFKNKIIFDFKKHLLLHISSKRFNASIQKKEKRKQKGEERLKKEEWKEEFDCRLCENRNRGILAGRKMMHCRRNKETTELRDCF